MPWSSRWASSASSEWPTASAWRVGGRERDGDVPEERSLGEPLDEVVRLIREREHVRRFVDPEELVVHLADLVVADDEDGERTCPRSTSSPAITAHGEMAQRIAHRASGASTATSSEMS